MTQTGAISREPAFAVAQRARENAELARAAADRMRAGADHETETTKKLVETPAEIRAAVMAERRVDRLQLLRLAAQARLEAEISINAETAARAHKAGLHMPGAFIDLLA